MPDKLKPLSRFDIALQNANFIAPAKVQFRKKSLHKYMSIGVDFGHNVDVYWHELAILNRWYP